MTGQLIEMRCARLRALLAHRRITSKLYFSPLVAGALWLSRYTLSVWFIWARKNRLQYSMHAKQAGFTCPRPLGGFQILVTVTYITLFPVNGNMRPESCNCKKKSYSHLIPMKNLCVKTAWYQGHYTKLRDQNFGWLRSVVAITRINLVMMDGITKSITNIFIF